jgi:hypothetical protein
MKKFLNTFRTKMSAFLSPQPEIQQEYVSKVVYLLRRDFSTKEQNEIIVAIELKLTELRKLDMQQMEKDYLVLQRDYTILKDRLAIN